MKAFNRIRGSADVNALTKRWICTHTPAAMRQEDFINDHIDDYPGLREVLVAHLVASKLEGE